jgi:phosphoglycolate phosphatase
MVYRTMEDLGVDKCIYVGDSEVDVATAKNADVPCLTVLWGFRDKDVLEQAGATHFCEKTEDMAAMIEQLIATQL